MRSWIVGSLGPEQSIAQRYRDLSPVLNERGLRRFAATEAQSYGRGGVSAVSRATGIARSTISRGMKEIAESRQVEAGRIRKPGGGRKAKLTEDSTLLADLGRLVEPATRGDPMRPLRWTSKSLRDLSEALRSLGHSVCPHVIADGLRKRGFRLQANRKTQEGGSHVDRNAQLSTSTIRPRRF